MSPIEIFRINAALDLRLDAPKTLHLVRKAIQEQKDICASMSISQDWRVRPGPHYGYLLPFFGSI